MCTDFDALILSLHGMGCCWVFEPSQADGAAAHGSVSSSWVVSKAKNFLLWGSHNPARFTVALPKNVTYYHVGVRVYARHTAWLVTAAWLGKPFPMCAILCLLCVHSWLRTIITCVLRYGLTNYIHYSSWIFSKVSLLFQFDQPIIQLLFNT